MAYNKNMTSPNKPKTVLQRLALVYLIEVIFLYGSFFIEWQHNRGFGLSVNWPFWIICTIALFLVPLGFIYRQRIKQSILVFPRVTTRFVFYYRLGGVILLAMPFILFYMIDIEHAVGAFYAQHGLAKDEYGAHGFLSASQLTYLIIYTSFAVGLYLLLLGRGQSTRRRCLVKALAVLAGALLLTYLCLIYGWVVWYPREA